MRLKLGRPDLHRYDDRFDVPEAETAFGATFLGVATVLLDDGETAVLTDGFFSRPSMASTSTAQLGRGAGLPEDRILVVTPGEPRRFGGFTLTWLVSEHCPPDRYPGTIDEPVTPPVRVGAYRCGEAWSILVEHTSGRTALVQGSAGFRAGALAGRSADVAYLGVGQLGVQDEEYLRGYWAETVEAVGAKQAVLLHWDDFFRPLHQPLRALPYAGDDLDVTMRVLGGLAAEQGVGLRFPTVWRREDPWALSRS